MSAHATRLSGISSMATRQVLAALARDALAATGTALALESVGGVEAERRVAAGEVLDLVFLARGALDRLQAAGHVVAGSIVDLMRSGIWVAVRAGAPVPAVADEAQLREAVLAARTIGCSTGPSGTYLTGLFEAWGIRERIAPRLVEARPGVPVGALIAAGEVELGFQQRSELVGLEGVHAIGPLPEAIQHTTVFAGAVCATSRHPGAARRLLEFLASPRADAVKQAHGMGPARVPCRPLPGCKTP